MTSRVLLVFLVMMLLVSSSNAVVRTVCNYGAACQYSSINRAIEESDPGDVVQVYSGVYKEALNISKSITLIGSDIGGGKPIIDPTRSSSDHPLPPNNLLKHLPCRGSNRLWENCAVILSADRIVFEGFNITNPSGQENYRYNYGIVVASKNCSVRGNNISYSRLGGIILLGSGNLIQELISKLVGKGLFGLLNIYCP
jgi:parallel beta-helix repeat protein